MPTSEQLLPCPFCGGEAEIERLGDRRQSTQYSCTNCGCFLETGEEWGHGKRWNTRVALSAAEGVKPRTITVSDRLAEELKTWAEDERAAWPTDTAFQDDLADLLAQLAAAEGVKPRIKPLEWIGVEGGPGNDLSAHPTPFMQYRLRHLSEGSFDVILKTDAGDKWFSESATRQTTYAEAKAAAQADYEARILSALEGE